jgi:hypothetical protein
MGLHLFGGEDFFGWQPSKLAMSALGPLKKSGMT